MSKFPQKQSRRTVYAAPLQLSSPGDLRVWQQEALDCWVDGGNRGIVAAATGSGKTRMALAAIRKFWSPGSRIAIVVPTIALQKQWVASLQKGFALEASQIGLMGGMSPGLREAHGFVVCVINSARTGLLALAAGWEDEGRQQMLIVDECHWAATRSNAEIFTSKFDATLGLSATPERSDDGLEDVLIPTLGKVVYRYSLLRALDDGLLASLKLFNVVFELSPPEIGELNQLEEQITRIEGRLLELDPTLNAHRGLDRNVAFLEASGSNGNSHALRELYQQRGILLERSDGRRVALDRLAQSGLFRGERVLIFHERIEEAKRTWSRLDRLAIRCSLDLSTDDSSKRSEALRDFRSGATNVLIAVRTLDEGIDLPDAKLAIIASGSFSPRQRLQRIGRILRPNGENATVISLLARGTFEESIINENDQFLVGGHRVTSIHLNDFLSSNSPKDFS
jgi:superfamily II DNA or RNA helicase